MNTRSLGLSLKNYLSSRFHCGLRKNQEIDEIEVLPPITSSNHKGAVEEAPAYSSVLSFH